MLQRNLARDMFGKTGFLPDNLHRQIERSASFKVVSSHQKEKEERRIVE